MGKIVATYLVKVTLREHDDVGQTDEAPLDPKDIPTNDAMASRVQSALVDLPFDSNATSERIDK